MVFEKFGKKMGDKAAGLFGFNPDGTKIKNVGKKTYGEAETPSSVPTRQGTSEEKRMLGDLTFDEVRRWNFPTLDPGSKSYHDNFKDSVKILYEQNPDKFNRLLEHVFVNSHWTLPKIPKPDIVRINNKRARFVLAKLAEENKMHWIGNDLQSEGLAEKMREKIDRPVTVAELFHQNPQEVADHIETNMNLHRIPFTLTIKHSLTRPLDDPPVPLETQNPSQPETPLQILKTRFAKGEISEEEFTRMKKLIE